MKNDLSQSSSRVPLRLTAITFLLSVLLVCFLSSQAYAQGKIDDFGAETIEGEMIPGLVSPEKVEDREKVPEVGKDSKEPNEDDISDLPSADLRAPAPAELNLNAKDIEISTLVKTISKVTGRNYIVDSGVKGKITIHLPTPVSLEEALRIFDSVLLLKGFTTVPVDKNVWKVVPTKNAKTTTIPIVYESPEVPSDILVTQLVRLKHVPATDMQQVLTQFISGDGGINTFEGTNSLILIDSAANIHRLLELVERLDVPATDQDITIIPIEHAEAQDIADKINDILGSEDEPPAAGGNARNRQAIGMRNRQVGSSAIRRQSATQSDASVRRRLPLKVLPDDRTNSLIVVADPELTVKVRALVDQLDSPLDKSSGRFYVYRLQHADAEELSEILNNLISGATSESTPSAGRTTGSSLSRSNPRAAAPASNRANVRNVSNRRRTAGNPRQGRVNFEGDVSIAPDPSTNSMIINASRSDYLRLKEVISELDLKRRQVLVEATLLEVRLTEEEGMGVELQGSLGEEDGGLLGQTNFGGLSNLLTNPSALSDLTLAAASTGTLTLPGGIVIPSQAALVSAFSNNSNVNVLSSPNILATDNEEAEIIVGENVPFVTSSSTDPSNLNNTFNSIERQDVGITLRITPQISQGDYVNLSIFVEISNVVPDTRNSPNGPTTTIRTTETTVEVKDGQMIVTGGLIADNITNSDRGVPFLKDVPFFGHLFRTDGSTQTRNNLLVFITPKIIRDQFEARESTLNYSNQIEDIYIETDGSRDHMAKLKSKGIDNVVDEIPPSEDDIIPTPITPPSANIDGLSSKELDALERTQSRLESITGPGTSKVKPGISAKVKRQEREVAPPPPPVPVEEEEVIEMNVSPGLPELDAPEVFEGELNLDQSKSRALPKAARGMLGDSFEGEIEPDLSAVRIKADQISIEEMDSEVSGNSGSEEVLSFKPSKSLALPVPKGQTFVVLKALKPEELADSGLVSADGLGTVGLAVPGKDNRFFAPGSIYRHQGSEQPLSFVVLGAYDSVSEAGGIHSSLLNPRHWQVISPADGLKLGRNDWKKSDRGDN